MLAAIRREPGAEDGPVPRELPFAGGLLEEQVEAVARLQIAFEVDLPGKHVGERHRELDRFSRCIDRRNDRRVFRVDVAADRDGSDLFLVGDDLRLERLRVGNVGADDAQKPVGVDLILEFPQGAVERSDEPVRTIRP